jgi:hypothetical protein
MRECVAWLEALVRDEIVVEKLSPERFERRNKVQFTPERVHKILERIAFDLDELAKARRVIDCDDSSLEHPHVRKRRRMAEDPVQQTERNSGPRVRHRRTEPRRTSSDQILVRWG